MWRRCRVGCSRPRQPVAASSRQQQDCGRSAEQERQSRSCLAEFCRGGQGWGWGLLPQLLARPHACTHLHLPAVLPVASLKAMACEW